MLEEVKVWLKQAQRDLITAKNSYNSKDYYASAFWSHQAAEKGLKALYLKSHKEIIKIHDLVKLSREIGAPLDIVSKSAQLNPIYFEVRYPDEDEIPSEKINEQNAVTFLKLAKEILTWIEETI